MKSPRILGLAALISALVLVAAGEARAEPHDPDERQGVSHEPLAEAAGPTTAREQFEYVVSEPVKLARSLQLLQDAIAQGDVGALKNQTALMAVISERLLEMPDETWKESRNRQAALAYVMSGGNPVVLRKALAQTPPESPDLHLLKGIYLYVMGDTEAAAKEIGEETNARDLPPSLGGGVALVQAALVVGKDNEKAVAYLNEARMLAPGTLVEEGALRRLTIIAGRTGNADLFRKAAEQYLRRFRNSVYAGNFRVQFMAGLVHMPFLKDAGQFSQAERLIGLFSPDAQLELYLYISRQALLDGHLGIAALSADKCMSLTPADSKIHKTAQFYAAASQITTESPDNAFQILLTLDNSWLSPQDASLLETVIDTAEQIREIAPGLRFRNLTDPRVKDDNILAESAKPPVPKEPGIVTRALAVIKASDTLLRSATQ